MGFDGIRNEISHMHRQVRRQQKEILTLRRAGISTASAETLLERIQARVDGLSEQRDRLVGEEKLKRPTYPSGKPLRGTPAHQRIDGCDGYGKFAAEVNVSPVKDPKQRPPVFSWQEKKSFGLTVYSFEASEKVLSVVTMRAASKFVRAVHTNEVLTCRDK
jgi:hypothetical protein